MPRSPKEVAPPGYRGWKGCQHPGDLAPGPGAQTLQEGTAPSRASPSHTPGLQARPNRLQPGPADRKLCPHRVGMTGPGPLQVERGAQPEPSHMQSRTMSRASAAMRGADRAAVLGDGVTIGTAATGPAGRGWHGASSTPKHPRVQRTGRGGGPGRAQKLPISPFWHLSRRLGVREVPASVNLLPKNGQDRNSPLKPPAQLPVLGCI